jgi:hypothetical protein
MRTGHVFTSLIMALLVISGNVWAQHKGEKMFHAILTDGEGMETEVKNLIFYWEEKVSETAFVPHELKQVPVKRGTATVNVRFDTIKQIDVKPGVDKAPPVFTITLNNGKTGEFALAISGSFKGESDFGEVEVPADGIKKIVFK